MLRRLALVVALLAGFTIFYFGAVTPRPAPVSAPGVDFSARRAFADIQSMGAVPHPLGSAADARVRDILAARMNSLGLSTQIQRAEAIQSHGPRIASGRVDNVIGVLRGRDRNAPALVLMAHHDSVPGSPGAADDTAGVATVLEVIRAIKARGAPARDVMAVITDGEEVGLLGARAFYDSALSAHVGYVINLEAGGGGGRAIMFETAARNGADIALYQRTAVTPESNSSTVFVYQNQPNDTDFTVAKGHGKPGLNYAFVGRHFDYHSPSSTPAALDLGALQHMGQQVLPTAAALAFGPLPHRAPDLVYGNVLFGLSLAYPPWVGWLILTGCAAFIVTGAILARRRHEFSWVSVARGLGAGVYLVALSGAALELARRATGVGSGFMEFRPLLARFPAFEFLMLAAGLAAILATAALMSRRQSRWIAAALPPIVAAAACAAGGWNAVTASLGLIGLALGLLSFGQPARPGSAWAGVLTTGLIFAAGLQAVAPTAANTATWPLAAAVLAFLLSGGGGASAPRNLAVQTIIAALTLGWVGALFHSLLVALDFPVQEVLPTAMAALVIWPLATAEFPAGAKLWPAGLLFFVSLAIAVTLQVTSPWTPRHPNSVEPIFVIDPDAHQAWRASQTPLDAWTRNVLAAEGGALAKHSFTFSPAPIDAAPAAYVSIDLPMVKAAADEGGNVTITATPHPGAGRIVLRLRSARLLDNVRVNGHGAVENQRGRAPRPFSLPAGQWGAVIWTAPGEMTLRLHTGDPAHLQIGATEIYDRWMSVKPLPRPPTRDQMWSLAGSTYVERQVPVQAASAP